ncbi:TatD family hydrolase [Candidatus Gracilibacteria bacterium]|nr:TatD family hydrolase [Candidatus Gracilibacteria bacterium]MCF7897091.1 TatD family hydrolase [Candidatus Gracilibacteria bacterium]
MHLVDTHCHLDFPELQKDFDEVLARAHSAGVKKFINPGVGIEESRKAVQLSSEHENIFAAVGIHPHEADSVDEKILAELEVLAQNSKVVAIGEIGLDFFKLRNSKEIQIAAFEKQLGLAQKLDLPLIVHAREADAEIFKILDKFPSLRGVLHCFGGDWSFAEKVLERGFFIGLTGIVTFPNAKNVREVAQKIPLEKLLIETDAPFLAPQKFRGQRCEPAFVVEVAEEVARLRGIEISEIAEKTTKNAEELFRI